MRNTLTHPWGHQSFAAQVFAGISVVMIVAFVGTIGLWVMDPRVIGGLSVWAKPLKFEFALAVHAGTLAIVVARLSPKVQKGPLIQGVALAFLAACLIEMGWILFQAALAQHSHFNETTAFHRVMFSVMAFAAVIITGAATAIAVSVWRDPDATLGTVLKTGILLGFVGGTILTFVTAFAIGARGGPYIGPVPLLSSRMMVTGWSLTGGDLRVPHFFATHMIQAVPVAALWASRMRNAALGRSFVLFFAVLWASWTLIEFGVALSGNRAAFLSVMP